MTTVSVDQVHHQIADLVAIMGTDIPTELLALKEAVKAANAGPLMPPKARAALEHSCHVIELVTVELAHLRQTLAQHLHLRVGAFSAESSA